MTNIPLLKDSLNEVNSNIFASTKGKFEPSSDPFMAGVSYSVAQMKTAFYTDMYDSINQCFSKTATEESFLAAIAFDKTNNNIQRKLAEFATGQVLVVSDTDSIDIEVGSKFIATDGSVFETTVFKSTSNQSFIISSLERIDDIAYATILSHNLGNLMTLTISGANETAFNGDYEITIVDEDTISFTNTGDDETATGTILGSFYGVRIDVTSVLADEASNKTYNNTIEIGFTTDLTDAYITYDGITGGTDIETLSNFQSRIIDYLQYPQNAGNIYQHQSWITENTDANYCYFFNSEDDDYLYLKGVISKMDEDNYTFTDFTSDELSNIKASFIDDNQFCLTGVSALQLSFVNFSSVSINITISGLTPLSTNMKTAINLRLKEYIALLPINFYLSSGALSSDKISSVITGARDIAGNTPSFDSISISGATFTDDIQKPILGTISYA